MARLSCLVGASLAGVNLIFLAVSWRRQIRHHDIGTSHQAELASRFSIKRGQCGSARDIGLGTHEPSQSQDLVDHEFRIGRLLASRKRPVPLSSS